MDYRKTEKTNLENKKGVFFLIGALLILTITFASFSIKSYTDQAYNFEMQVDEEMMELPPVTTPPPPPPPPPPPVHAAVEPIIKLVEDEVKTEDPKFDDQDINDVQVDDNQVGEAPPAPSDDLEDVPLVYVSNMPSLPGCSDFKTNDERNACTQKMIKQLLADNFQMPDIARELGQSGIIYVRFIIDKTGSVTNIEILKGINEYLDKEAINTVKKLPKFKPGSSMDRPVSLLYTVPLNVTLVD